MIAVATLAAVSAISVAEDLRFVKTTEVKHAPSIETFQAEIRRKRFLRTGDTSKTDYYYDPDKRDGQRPVFIEDKLEESLTNPRKTTRLYEQWYKSGYSVKTVAGGLNQDENRELDRIYKNLAQGYAAYVKEKSL
ncbi:hypothetical protein Pcac1_g4326 [Phytophthora cactorum]|uniref:RxLR effector protein n=1 Tax=Phytophthora cactorum TaxID=29920 RepID=A0A329SEP7_9STRA|nr:hypothetical protein Pcac1_g4326 [Phytophthora cactorum]RAW34012.1 hypothetical protein PC110_g9663 [Phytophthora cactorum]